MIFQVLLLTAAFFGLLHAFCMHVRVGSQVFRGLFRAVSAVWTLALLPLVPGVTIGLNALNILMVSWLGAPGAVLMQVIAWMP